MDIESMGNVKAIKSFFEQGVGRTLTMAEMKALSTQDRHDLGELCRDELRFQEACLNPYRPAFLRASTQRDALTRS